MDRLDGDEALRVGVLTGAGGTFCAGMDLKAFVAGERPFVGDRGFAGIVQRPPVKPLIAAVEGWAVAGGFEVALACDLIVAARDAHFGIPEVKRGLVAAGGALIRLPRRIPYHLAAELALTGDPIDAERAYAVGLVDGSPSRAARWPPRASSPRTIAANGPLARRRHQAHPRAPTRAAPGSARRSSPTRCSGRRTRARGRGRSPRSARPGLAARGR